MITFDRGQDCFNFRVAGIALWNNQILLSRAKGDDFWACPGGRVEMGETSPQTLVREMQEELNATVEIIRLLWIVENFFVYAQKNYHEICFYYLMQFPKRSPYLLQDDAFWGVEDGLDLEFSWFSTNGDTLANLPLLPGFLQDSLNDLPTSVEHIMQRD